MTSNNKNHKASKTSYILDQESALEMTRLIEQARFVTQGQGSLFPGCSAHQLSRIHRVLDIACGPGEWACEVASTYPDMEVTALDISHRMIEYARVRAETSALKNIRFIRGNVLELEQVFSDELFDLINARFLFALLQEEGWHKLLRSCYRLLSPGGILLMTEVDHNTIARGDALIEFFEKVNRVMFRRGMSFAGKGSSMAITAMLPNFFREAGFEHLTLTPTVIDISDPKYRMPYIQDVKATALGAWELFRAEQIFTSRKQYDELMQRMVGEMSQPEFALLWHLLTLQGRMTAG